MILLKVFTKRCKTVNVPFRKKGQLRFIALILSCLFTHNTIASSAPSIQTTAFSENINFLESLKIPESLATVESRFNPENPAFQTPILYIQDAHAHPEAQKNIQLLLEHLAGQKKLKAIALESAVGKVDPAAFRFFPVPEANQAVYEDLAAHGELTGAELFALSQKISNMPLIGVDDLNFYRKSYAAYQKVISFKVPVQKILDLYGAEIEKIMALLPVDLGKMLRAELAWDGGADHLEYFHTLRDLSLKHLKLDFSDAQNQFNWPNLTRLMIAQRMQNSVKPEYLSGETRQLVELLNERIKNLETRRFLTEGLVKMGDARAGKDFHVWLVMNKTNAEIKSTRVFMEYLHDQARKAGISLINYPVLMDWAGLFILQEEVNASKLIEETNKVQDLLETKIVRSNNEKQILELIKDFQTIKKLLALKLTRESYGRFLIRRGELSGTALQKRFSNFSKKKLPRLPKGILSHAETFYQLSEQRDQALFENTLKLSTDQKKPGQAIALIAGGFHTSGLKSLFEKNRVPYLTLTPHMSLAGDESLYEKVMMGKNSADEESVLSAANLGAWLLLKKETKLPKRLLDRQRFVPGTAIRRSATPVLRAKGWSDERIQQSLEQLSPKTPATVQPVKTVPRVQSRLNTFTQAAKTHPVLYWIQRVKSSRSEVRTEAGDDDASNYGNVIWQTAQTEETLYYATHPVKEPELNAENQYWEAQQYLRDLYNTISDFAKANAKSSYEIQVKDAFYAKLLTSENISSIIESVIPVERRESGYLDQLDIFRILAKLRGKSFIPLYPQYAVPNIQPSYRIGLLVDPSKSAIEPLLFRELLGDPSIAVDVIVGVAPYQFYLTLNSSRYREFLPAGSVAYNDKENWVSILGKKITVIKNASQLSKEEWEAKHLHGFAATYNASAQINELADIVSVSKRAKAGEQAAHIRLLSIEDSNPFRTNFPSGPDKTTYAHGMESTRRLHEKNLVLSPSLAHVPARFYQEISGLSAFNGVETYFSLDYTLAPYLTQPPLDKSGRLKSGFHNQVMASAQSVKYLESSVQNEVVKVGSKKNVAKGVRVSSVPVGVGDRVKISLKVLGKSSINRLLINLGIQKKTKSISEEDFEEQIKNGLLKILEKKFSAPESPFSMKYSRGLVNTDARLEKKILVDSKMARVNLIQQNQGTSSLEIDIDLVFNREYQDAQQLLRVLNEVGAGVTANLPPIGANVDERYSPYGKQVQMAYQNQTIPPAPLEIPEKIDGLTPRPLRLGVLAPHGQVGFAGLRTMGYFLNLAAVAGTGPNLSELTHAVQMESVQGPFLSHRVEVPIEVKPNENNQNGGDVLGEVRFGDGTPFTLLRRYGTPNEIPWAKFGVDFVVDGSGEFDDPTDPASILGHLSAGRNKDTGAAGAFLTAPFTSSPANPDEIKQFSTVVYPLNLAAIQKQFSGEDVAKIVSNASCTTNCAALMTEWGNRFQKATTQLLREKYGIPEAELTGVQISQATTVHAPTNTQQVIDAAISNDAKNASRLRSAAGSIQTSSGVSKAIKQLNIKGNPWPLAFTGFAVRVGLSTTSLVYMPAVFSVKGLSEESRKKLVENKADLEKNLVKVAEKTAKAMASDPQFKDAVRFAGKEEAFTSEIIVGSKDGAIFDGQQIQALFQPESDLIAVNLLGWYDNVNGYMWQASRTLNEVAKVYFNASRSEARSSGPVLDNIQELFSIDLKDDAQKAIYEPYMAVLEAADKYSRYWVTASNGKNNRLQALKQIILNSKNKTKTSIYLSLDIFLPLKDEPNGIQAYWSMLEALLKTSEHDKQDEQKIMALFHAGLLDKLPADAQPVSPDQIGYLLSVAALLKTDQKYKKFVPYVLSHAPANYSSPFYSFLENHLSTNNLFLEQLMKEFMSRFSHGTSAQSGIKGLIRLLESIYRHTNADTKKIMYRIFWGNVTYKDLSLGTVLNGHQLSLEELLKSTLFIQTGTSRRKNLIQDKITLIADLKAKIGEPVFKKMIEFWGFDAVSIWAEQAAKDSNWIQKRKELFEIILTISPSFNDPIPSAFVMLKLAEKKRPDLMGLAIDLLEEAHELEEHVPELLKIISRHTPYTQDPVTHHAEDYAPLIAYLFTLKKITGANYVDSPSRVTELLYGGTGRVYYLANKLAGLMARADFVDFTIPRKLALDMDPREQDNQLFHYIRVKVHRETNKHDLDVVYQMMKALMLANLEEETQENRSRDLEKLIQDSIFKTDLHHKAQFAKDVQAGAQSQLGRLTGKFLTQMLGQSWNDLSKEAILRADISTFNEKPLKAEDRVAYRYAKTLIELYQNLYLYYEGSLESAGKSTRSQYQGLTHEQVIAKMEEIEKKRLLNKEKLTQRFEFNPDYGIPEPRTYAQLHDPDPRDKYNFPDVGTWTDYHEPKYDAFKQDQKDALAQDGLFEEFVSNRLPVLINEVRDQMRNEIPGASGNISPQVAKSLKLILRALELFSARLDLEGFSVNRMKIYGRILNERMLTVHQAHNLLSAMMSELYSTYDFYREKFGSFSKQIALAAGRPGVLDLYLRQGEEQLTEQDWAHRVQETFIGNLRAEDKGVVLLEQLLEQTNKLFEELKPHYKKQIGSENLKDPNGPSALITIDEFDSAQQTPLEMGSKGYDLMRLYKEGFPVPALATLTTGVWAKYQDMDASSAIEKAVSDPIFRRIVLEAILNLEKLTQQTFHFESAMLFADEKIRVQDARQESGLDPEIAKPLFLSGRSGALPSMPGIMDTVINLPMNEWIIQDLITRGENPQFVYDVARRFLDSFGQVYYGVDSRELTRLVDVLKERHQQKKGMPTPVSLSEFSGDEMKEVFRLFLQRMNSNRLQKMHLETVPFEASDNPHEAEPYYEDSFTQVLKTVAKIFASWSTPEAKEYRKMSGLSDDFGTAVNLVHMIFGNRGKNSGTGIIFTRNPDTGSHIPSGDIRKQSQGPDLVGGRTGNFMLFSEQPGHEDRKSLEKEDPDLYQDILRVIKRLSERYKNRPLDVEISWDEAILDPETGRAKIFILQVRPLRPTKDVDQKKLKLPPKVTIENHLIAKGLPVSANATIGRLLDARGSNYQEYLQNLEHLRQEMDAHDEQGRGIILVMDYATDEDALKIMGEDAKRFGVQGLINGGISASSHAALTARDAGIAFVGSVKGMVFKKDALSRPILIFNEGSPAEEIFRFGMEGPLVAIDGYSNLVSPTGGMILLANAEFKLKDAKKRIGPMPASAAVPQSEPRSEARSAQTEKKAVSLYAEIPITVEVTAEMTRNFPPSSREVVKAVVKTTPQGTKKPEPAPGFKVTHPEETKWQHFITAAIKAKGLSDVISDPNRLVRGEFFRKDGSSFSTRSEYFQDRVSNDGGKMVLFYKVPLKEVPLALPETVAMISQIVGQHRVQNYAIIEKQLTPALNADSLLYFEPSLGETVPQVLVFKGIRDPKPEKNETDQILVLESPFKENTRYSLPRKRFLSFAQSGSVKALLPPSQENASTPKVNRLSETDRAFLQTVETFTTYLRAHYGLDSGEDTLKVLKSVLISESEDAAPRLKISIIPKGDKDDGFRIILTSSDGKSFKSNQTIVPAIAGELVTRLVGSDFYAQKEKHAFNRSNTEGFGFQLAKLYEELTSKRSEVRASNSKKSRLPDIQYAQDVLDLYRLKLNSLNITSLRKGQSDKNLLRGTQLYAAMTAGLETLAPYWLQGQGVGRDKKEITQIKTLADGMAVAIRIQMLLAAVAKDLSFAIVVRGDEGGRDESYSLEVGGIYWGGYEGGFKSFKVETAEGMKALEKEIQKLRDKKIKVLGHVGDALDGTTPLVEGKFGSTTVLGWSAGFDFFVPDDLRAGGVILNLPYNVRAKNKDFTDFLSDPAADFKTIVSALAHFYGMKKDHIAEQAIWAFLGPKGGKDWTGDKHQQLIVDTQSWHTAVENKVEQLSVVTPSDGNVPFVALAAAGITALIEPGKKQRWVAIGRSGFPEAISSGLIVAANSGGQALLRVVSKVGTDAVYNSRTVNDYNQSERVLMSALKVPQTHFVAGKNYKGIFTMGSINGLDRNQVGVFADVLQGVRINEKKRTLSSDVFFSTPQGNFVLHFEFLSDDLDATRAAFLNAPSFLAAPKVQPRSEVRRANLTRESLQPVNAEVLKLNRGLSSVVFVTETAARKMIDPELVNSDTLAAWELLMFGGNATLVNDASQEIDLRLTSREASKEAARTVVLVDTGTAKGITADELNAMELAAGSRLVVLESQQSTGKTWDNISKIKFSGNITPARLNFEGALPTEAEISKALKQSPGNIPVVVFPELTSDEVLAEYQNVSSQEGFVVSMPKNKEARFAFSYLLGHSLPGTLLKDVPSDDLLKVTLRSDALSRAYVPVWAEGRFAQWAVERMRDRLFAQAA